MEDVRERLLLRLELLVVIWRILSFCDSSEIISEVIVACSFDQERVITCIINFYGDQLTDLLLFFGGEAQKILLFSPRKTLFESRKSQSRD